MIAPVNSNDYGKKALYRLICDSCGKEGRYGLFSECRQAIKDKGWKCKSIRTKSQDERYLWSHLCKLCKEIK